ncbi:Acg family FMN-binding oxidoreductase [Streptomyces aidingensis]|uniref:Acg family FMN-binding oxidoreductase n=1 Tax=Streptomyces aidingensis TaxID=910347 RepID=UPI003CCBC191
MQPEQPAPSGRRETVGEETARSLVRAATAAPSMHNAQPWRFRLLRASGTIELRADLGRVLPHTDPTGRGLHIGCGAAVFNLRVAAAGAGWDASVRLLPAPEDPRLLATIGLDRAAPAPGPGRPRPRPAPAGHEDPAGLIPLGSAVFRRHTNRFPFRDEPVHQVLRAQLADAAAREGAQLVFPDDWHTRNVLELTRDAEGRDAADPGRLKDLDRWTRTGDAAGAAVDGVPEYAFGPRQRDGHRVIRDFAGRGPDREAAGFEAAPQLALLGTTEDRPFDWLRAGEALERVLLTATLRGLSVSLTSQALEWEDLRPPVRDPVGGAGFVQMVLRIGYGPGIPATPRRPVDEVLEIV